MITHIIFDWGGVCTTGHLLRDFLASLSKNCNKESSEIERVFRESEYLYETGKITPNIFWNNFRNKLVLNMPAEKIQQIFLSSYHLNEKIIDYIKELKKYFKIVLLSNNYEDMFSHLKQVYNLSQYFDFMFSSSEIGFKKPELGIYNYVLEKLAIPPQNAIFIDNKEKNVLAAKEIGFKGIIFEGIDKLKTDIESEIKIVEAK